MAERDEPIRIARGNLRKDTSDLVCLNNNRELIKRRAAARMPSSRRVGN